MALFSFLLALITGAFVEECTLYREQSTEECSATFKALWSGAKDYLVDAMINGADEADRDEILNDYLSDEGFMGGADYVGMNCGAGWGDDPLCQDSEIWNFWNLLDNGPVRCYLHYGPELVFHNWTSGVCQQRDFGLSTRFTDLSHCEEVCKEAATCNHYDATTRECAAKIDQTFEEVNMAQGMAARQGIDWMAMGIWHEEISKVLTQSEPAKFINQNCDIDWDVKTCKYSPHGKLLMKVYAIDYSA